MYHTNIARGCMLLVYVAPAPPPCNGITRANGVFALFPPAAVRVRPPLNCLSPSLPLSSPYSLTLNSEVNRSWIHGRVLLRPSVRALLRRTHARPRPPSPHYAKPPLALYTRVSIHSACANYLKWKNLDIKYYETYTSMITKPEVCKICRKQNNNKIPIILFQIYVGPVAMINRFSLRYQYFFLFFFTISCESLKRRI